MSLLSEIKKCSLCIDDLPLEPKPILQFSAGSRVLIVGQAPGKAAHENGIPWSDASGERLREWLQISKEDFYDADKLAIVPMGFCFPGKAATGDLPPRPECRARWMDIILSELTNLQLIILIGQHAAQYFLGEGKLVEHIKKCVEENGTFIVLPHPSPRNNIWLSKNEWFKQNLPYIREKVHTVLNHGA